MQDAGVSERQSCLLQMVGIGKDTSRNRHQPPRLGGVHRNSKVLSSLHAGRAQCDPMKWRGMRSEVHDVKRPPSPARLPRACFQLWVIPAPAVSQLGCESHVRPFFPPMRRNPLEVPPLRSFQVGPVKFHLPRPHNRLAQKLFLLDQQSSRFLPPLPSSLLSLYRSTLPLSGNPRD